MLKLLMLVVLAVFLVLAPAGCKKKSQDEGWRAAASREDNTEVRLEKVYIDQKSGSRGSLDTTPPKHGAESSKPATASSGETVKEGPGGLPGNIPAYNGASLELSRQKSEREQVARFRSGDAAADIFKFYEGSMAAGGWNILDKIESPPFFQMVAVNDDRKAVVSVKEENGESFIDIAVLPAEKTRMGRGRKDEDNLQGQNNSGGRGRRGARTR